MARKPINPEEKKIQVQVMVEKKKLDKLTKEVCQEISQNVIEKEYKKSLKTNKP